MINWQGWEDEEAEFNAEIIRREQRIQSLLDNIEDILWFRLGRSQDQVDQRMRDLITDRRGINIIRRDNNRFFDQYARNIEELEQRLQTEYQRLQNQINIAPKDQVRRNLFPMDEAPSRSPSRSPSRRSPIRRSPTSSLSRSPVRSQFRGIAPISPQNPSRSLSRFPVHQRNESSDDDDIDMNRPFGQFGNFQGN